MIDTKLTRVEMNGKQWVDGGQVELGFDKVWRTQPELMEDQELADLVGDIKAKGKGVLAITGVSSSGLLTLQEERARKVDEFEVFDFRLMHNPSDLDKNISRDDIEFSVDEEGDFMAFEVPANASIDCINQWLLANYPDYHIDVEVTTSTSSGVGANIMTGLLGENRDPVEANGLVMIVGGEVVPYRGKQKVNQFRGTQGYAGIAKRVRVVARKAPLNPSMLLVPLKGNSIETSFADSYAKVLSHMAPWMFGYSEGVRISAADVLSMSGMRTIHRVNYHGDMSGFQVPAMLAGHMDAEHQDVICFRASGPVSLMEEDGFYDAIFDLNDAGIIGEVKPIDNDRGVNAVTALRGQVPERAREENLDPEMYSTSMDRDVKILFEKNSVDFADETIRAAYEAAYQEVIRCYQPLEELQKHGVHFTMNGHFVVKNNMDYSRGGHNPHPRVTGAIANKDKIIAAKREVMKRLNIIHGKKFGPFIIHVLEGEKHYSMDELGQQHFAASQKGLARARAELTVKAGLVHNARAPRAYIETVRSAGYDL